MTLLGRLLRKEGLYTGPKAGIISLFLCKEVMVGKMSLFHSIRLITAGFKFLQDLFFLLSMVWLTHLFILGGHCVFSFILAIHPMSKNSRAPPSLFWVEEEILNLFAGHWNSIMHIYLYPYLYPKGPEHSSHANESKEKNSWEHTVQAPSYASTEWWHLCSFVLPWKSVWITCA